jgi:S1-C subfamily serine protease
MACLVVLAAAGGGAVSARVFAPDDAPAPVAEHVTQPVVSSGTEPRLQDAVRAAGPSVVEVKTDVGLGSGVIVEPQGLIITNFHVIRGASRVEVKNASGTSLAAEVIRTNESQDLAVLRTAGDIGPGVQLVDDAVGPPEIGAPVFAIGSPFGFQNTVTAGIVSAFREDNGRPVIQFDAPVNPGNSGGGLFNLEGRLIGIPTSIQSPVQGNVGLGFAVPASRVRQMLAGVS